MRWAGLLAVAMLVQGMAYAQEAGLTGLVRDQTGAAIPGAQVLILNLGTGLQTSTHTDDQGYYTFELLPPGSYRLEVEKPGFNSVVRSGIELNVQRVLRLDLTMTVGAVTQEVNVTEKVPLLERESSSLHQLISRHDVENLPLRGRNPYALAQLIPGARVPQSINDVPVDNFTTQFVSINGARGYQNEYLLDGVPNTNPGQAGPTVFPSVDVVQEYRVTTNNYSAEYGRAVGGLFNVVTRSGTNQLHGSVYEFLRNDRLDANDFFLNRAGKNKPPFRFNQFGFTFGGPIIKNRTFIFAGYEGVREVQGVTFAGTVPTPLQRQGDFSQTFNAQGQLIQIFNPLTTRPDPNRPSHFIRDPFSGNVIRPGQIDRVARALLQFFPLPNTAGNPPTGVNNFISAASQTVGKDNFSIRVDHQLSGKQRLYGEFFYDRSPQIRPNAYGNAGSPSFGPQIFARRAAVLGDSYSFGSTLIVDFRYGFNRLANTRSSLSQGFDLTQLGWPLNYAEAVQPRSLPAIFITGFGGAFSLPNLGPNTAMGDSSLIFSGFDTHTWQGGLTKVVRTHTLKSGGEFRLMRRNSIQRTQADNNFGFTPSFTQGPDPTVGSSTSGFSLASFLLGTANSGQVQIVPGLELQELYYGFYAQDDFKVTPKLTLNLGLRYEYQSPRTDRHNQLTNFDFRAVPPLTAPGLNLHGVLSFVGVGENPRGQWNAERGNFAPRIGFAFSVTPKTVLRAAFGIFYAPNYTAAVNPGPDFFGLSGFSSTTAFVGTVDGIGPVNFLRDPYPQGLVQPTGSSLGPATLLGQSVAFADRNYTTPYSEQWNLNIQRELHGSFLLQVGYVGTRGVHLYGYRVLNQLPAEFLALGNKLLQEVSNPFFGQITNGPLSGPTVSPGQLLRPFPHFGDVTAVNSTWGSSTYHALQLSAERRLRGGLSLTASYTWSKLIDDVTGPFAGETLSGTEFQDNNNLRGERSVSSLDIPHRFVVGYIWHFPIGAGNRFLNRGLAGRVLGGWQVAGITTFGAGNVLGVTSAANTASSFGGGQRPDWNGRSPVLKNRSVDQWFDTGVFQPPPPFTFGNAPRTIPGLRSQGTRNFDFSVIKNTHLRERLNVQFRTECFNLFNTVRFAPPNTSFGTPNFGGVSSQLNSPRIIQLGLKFLF